MTLPHDPSVEGLRAHDPAVDGFPVTPVWPEDYAGQAQPVNQVVFAQPIPLGDGGLDDGVYMLLGHLAPPIWLDPVAVTDGVQRTQGRFEIEPRGSFYLSRARAEEIWRVLGRHLGHSVE